MAKKGYQPVGNAPPENKCPTVEEVIGGFLENFRGRKPKMFPSDPFQAANYWRSKQEPGDRFTEAAQPPVEKGKGWKTPYHDRLLYTLKQFLALKPVEQVFVIEHIGHGIPWRGDDIHVYRAIVDEHHRMQQSDMQAYIDEGFKKMKKVLKGMTV